MEGGKKNCIYGAVEKEIYFIEYDSMNEYILCIFYTKIKRTFVSKQG